MDELQPTAAGCNFGVVAMFGRDTSGLTLQRVATGRCCWERVQPGKRSLSYLF